jgi:hypothetical protein
MKKSASNVLKFPSTQKPKTPTAAQLNRMVANSGNGVNSPTAISLKQNGNGFIAGGFSSN